MGKVEMVIKSEIQRQAKREARLAFFPLWREVRATKLQLSGLSKNFALLERWVKERVRQAKGKKLKLEAPPEKVKASSITPERISSLRKKLGISQRELAILTGVSRWAVVMWEKGKFKPKGDKKASLLALRKLSKPDLKKMLAAKARGKKKVKLAKGKGKKPKAKRRSRK
jgi:DNA-binding transcriptional regulator YiaG